VERARKLVFGAIAGIIKASPLDDETKNEIFDLMRATADRIKRMHAPEEFLFKAQIDSLGERWRRDAAVSEWIRVLRTLRVLRLAEPAIKNVKAARYYFTE
jgi:hypothetical protein